MKKKIIGVIFAVVLLNGCYTQLSVVRREPPPEPVVTYEVDSIGDTVKVVRQTDTVTKDHENGYWTRNMWGEAEWRSGSPYYSHSWYLYNDYPWWYNSYPYYYDFSGRCPQYYYYDGGFGGCRQFGGQGNWGNYGNYHYDQNRRSGGGGAIIGPSDNRQSQHRSRVSPAPQQNSTTPSQTGASKMLSSDAKNQAPAGAGPGAPVSSAPPSGGTIQSSPPPASSPSPPPSNNGGSENKERNHRNPRSF